MFANWPCFFFLTLLLVIFLKKPLFTSSENLLIFSSKKSSIISLISSLQKSPSRIFYLLNKSPHHFLCFKKSPYHIFSLVNKTPYHLLPPEKSLFVSSYLKNLPIISSHLEIFLSSSFPFSKISLSYNLFSQPFVLESLQFVSSYAEMGALYSSKFNFDAQSLFVQKDPNTGSQRELIRYQYIRAVLPLASGQTVGGTLTNPSFTVRCVTSDYVSWQCVCVVNEYAENMSD